jgi:ureidoglycolate dehydrogenase (NAD+)
MQSIGAEELTKFCKDILRKAGLSQNNAEKMACSLIEANLRGVDSHGIMRLPHYVKAMIEGSISVDPKLRLRKVAQSCAILDADHGPGQIAGVVAMEQAIRLAHKTGVGFVGVKNSGHFGAAAYFAMRALEHDMIGIATTTTEADMIPFGAKETYLGNSPIAIAIPAKQEFPIVLDFSTSTVTYGRILLAVQEGKTIPLDWGVDEEGKQTSDPKRVRALYPMSGHKGSGLAIAVNILAGVLFGAPFGPHISGLYFSPRAHAPQTLGHLLVAVDISSFVPAEQFKNNVDQMIKEIKALEPSEGFKEVLLPGELEARTREKRLTKGIPLDEGACSTLRNLAREWKTELPTDLL